jgi:hypothetical protein
MEISSKDGTLLVLLARRSIIHYLKTNSKLKDPNLDKFNEKRGVFVTLHAFPSNQLRGCIGFIEPIYMLKEALVEAAISAATRDPRFSPVKLEDMEKITVEVSVLTPLQLIDVKDRKNYPNEIKIGTDGLVVKYGTFSGVLLPQVASEWAWDAEEFLSQTCMKAGLTPDMWLDEKTQVFKFQSQIFKETKPKGQVIESRIPSC